MSHHHRRTARPAHVRAGAGVLALALSLAVTGCNREQSDPAGSETVDLQDTGGAPASEPVEDPRPTAPMFTPSVDPEERAEQEEGEEEAEDAEQG